MTAVVALSICVISTLDGIFPGDGENYYLGVAKSSVLEIRPQSVRAIGQIQGQGAFVGTDARHAPLISEPAFKSLVPYNTEPFVVSDPFVFRDFSRKVLGIWSGVIFTQRGQVVSIDHKVAEDPGDTVRRLEFTSDMQAFRPRVNKEETLALVCLYSISKLLNGEQEAFAIAVSHLASNKTQLYRLPLFRAQVLQAEFVDSNTIVILASEDLFFKGTRNARGSKEAKGELYRLNLLNSTLSHIRTIAVRDRAGYLATIGSTLAVLGVNGVVKVNLRTISVPDARQVTKSTIQR